MQQADITFAMLSDPAAALEVATGPKGAASGERARGRLAGRATDRPDRSGGSSHRNATCMQAAACWWPCPGCHPPVKPNSVCRRRPTAGVSAGKGYVDVSTVDAATSQRIAEAVRAAGGLFLEAPVSGSKGPAEQGALIFLTAGARPGAAWCPRGRCTGPHSALPRWTCIAHSPWGRRAGWRRSTAHAAPPPSPFDSRCRRQGAIRCRRRPAGRHGQEVILPGRGGRGSQHEGASPVGAAWWGLLPCCTPPAGLAVVAVRRQAAPGQLHGRAAGSSAGAAALVLPAPAPSWQPALRTAPAPGQASNLPGALCVRSW